MKKLNCILLIDDDEATNFLHQLTIEEINCCDHLVVIDSALDALEYLKSPDTIKPDLIFLDINMPKMNGWQFLEECEKIQISNIPSVVILTTSLNPYDKEKATEIKQVSSFNNKPLTEDMIIDAIENYCSESIA